MQIKEQPKIVLRTSLIEQGFLPQGRIGNPFSPEFNVEMVKKLADPQYQQSLDPDCFICVDGRDTEQGRNQRANGIYPQTAGGEVLTKAAIQILTDPAASNISLSGCVGQAVKSINNAGRQIQMHGDTHHGPGGCGANANIRPAIELIASQAKPMIKTTIELMELSGLKDIMEQEGFTIDTMVELIQQAAVVSANESFWDKDAAEVTKQVLETVNSQSIENYLDLTEDHLEKYIIIDLREEIGFDEQTFMTKQFDNDNNNPVEAFVCSLGAYKKLLMDEVNTGAINKITALKHLAAFILFNLAVCVKLTSGEQPLPVIVLGAAD